MLQASQSARIKRNDENKTGVRCGWSPWILIAVQLLSQLYFWPVYSGPTQNTHATERDLNIPKVARPNFCCQYIHIEALAFPHHYQKSFFYTTKCKIFEEFDLKAGRPQTEWDLNKHIKSASNLWGKECLWFTTLVPTRGYSLSHAGAAFLSRQNYLASDGWYSRWEPAPNAAWSGKKAGIDQLITAGETVLTSRSSAVYLWCAIKQD